MVTDNNLNEMLKGAKTAADHEAIAAYYDREAVMNEKEARLHHVSANIFYKPPNQAQCNSLANAYEAAARQDKALAAYHQKMAKKLASEAGH